MDELKDKNIPENDAEKEMTGLEAEGDKEIKKASFKDGLDIPAIIRTIVCLGVAGAMTYLTVWLEYTWLADTSTYTYAGMLRFWLVNNSGSNKPLFYSLIVCGFVVWAVLAFAIMALIMKGFRALVKKLKLKKKAKGHK